MKDVFGRTSANKREQEIVLTLNFFLFFLVSFIQIEVMCVAYVQVQLIYLVTLLHMKAAVLLALDKSNLNMKEQR